MKESKKFISPVASLLLRAFGSGRFTTPRESKRITSSVFPAHQMAYEVLTRSLAGRFIKSGSETYSKHIRQQRRRLPPALPPSTPFKHDPHSLTYRSFSTAVPAAANLEPFNESTRFEYLTPLPLYEVERPFQLLRPVREESNDKRDSNCQWDAVASETVTDVRGLAFEPTLDQQGFIVRRSPTVLTSEQFDNRDMTETFYMPEMYDLLKREVEGADLVVGFDHQVRIEMNGDRRRAEGGPGGGGSFTDQVLTVISNDYRPES